MFFLAILISSCAPKPDSTGTGSTLPLVDCVLKSPEVEIQVDAKCGSLMVYEEPDNPESRRIDLAIAVVEAIKRNPEPDPLFILVGGPGQSALETYPVLSSSLFSVHQDRDIVLVDQRGTGKSNPLHCLDPEDETLDDERAIALLKECPEKLEADLRFYTTDIAMQDLERVRAALGYETINLYGASYGTRAALVYLKMYPERVRSMVLDAVVDPDFVIYQDAAQDGGLALELFFDRCESDDACHSTYPNLRSDFEALLEELDKSPADIDIPNPLTWKPLELVLSDSQFASIIFNTLYSPDLVAMLPLSIHQAYTEDNYAPLIAQGSILNAGLYDGMFYAVACNEDAPLVTEGTGTESLFGSSLQNFVEICAAWTKKEPPQVVHEPVDSDVPVLMLSGQADPITPPRHAEGLAKSLDNSLHLVFKGMGHGNAVNDCASRIITRFIETASTNELDTSCVKEVEPPPFFVDFSGPRP